MQNGVRILRLVDTGDSRGSSFVPPLRSLVFIDTVRDIHIATINPGAVRGNHYHQYRREILCILYSDRWSFHWDSGPNTETQMETFSGSGVVVVEIEPQASHVLRNDGTSEIRMIGFSNLSFNPAQPDSHRRQIA
jgi:dTDP-4-dehydrorhamnose 3,5-epimerase-like enzyme